MLLNTISCLLSNSMKNFESNDMRHDFRELTDLQVNSFIFVMEESSMQLTPATNFDTLGVRMEYFNFSIWVLKCRNFYVQYNRAVMIIRNKRIYKV